MQKTGQNLMVRLADDLQSLSDAIKGASQCPATWKRKLKLLIERRQNPYYCTDAILFFLDWLVLMNECRKRNKTSCCENTHWNKNFLSFVYYCHNWLYFERVQGFLTEIQKLAPYLQYFFHNVWSWSLPTVYIHLKKKSYAMNVSPRYKRR